VYRARDPVLDRDVALKLLHHDSRRLREEAATLATLDHPNVVGVLDYVESDESRAMVMELVEGVSLRDWLDERPRTNAEVVQRFVEVGSGLAAVHERGLVHRDFKPDNVVVDAGGRARLIDFGLVRSWRTDEPAPAEGTPRYMAPEQRAGSVPTPAADQYSFCVALEESLRGRATLPRRAREALLRGMAEDPEARWPNLHALLQQLTRRPWHERHGLALGVVATLGAVGLASVALMDERPGTPVTECPADIPSTADRIVLPEGEAWARAQANIDRHVEQWSTVRAAVCETPEVDAQRVGCLRYVDVHYSVLGDLVADGTVADPSVAAQASDRVPDAQQCADPLPLEVEVRGENREAMVRLAHASFAWTRGDYARAAAESEAVWTMLSSEADCPTRAYAAHIHGIARQRLGEPELALEWFDHSIHEAMSCGVHSIVAEAAGRALQVASDALGQRDAIDRYGQMGEAALERSGNPPRARAIFVSARGIARSRFEDFEGGLLDTHEAARLMEQEVGPRSYELVAYVANYGSMLAAAGRLADAAEQFERAHRITVAERGQDSHMALSLQSNLASLDIALGKDARALERLRANLAAYETSAPGSGRDRLTTLLNLAELELSRRELAVAKGHYQDALEILGDPSNEPRMGGSTVARLGSIAAEEGDLDEAEQLIERARIILAEEFGPESEEMARTLLQLGLLRSRQGRTDDALALLGRVGPVIGASPDSNLRATWRTSLARIHSARGEHEDALEHARAGIRIEGLGSSDLAAALFALAQVERAAGLDADALEHGREAARLFRSIDNPRSEQVASWLAGGAAVQTHP